MPPNLHSAGDPSTASERLLSALRSGVAFHNSDLNRANRHQGWWFAARDYCQQVMGKMAVAA